MAPKASIQVLAALLALSATAETQPQKPPHRYIGVQMLVVAGVHRDIAGSQYGIGAGPLIQAQAGGSRLNFNLEGIPVVSIPDTRPSVEYGQATPALGVINDQLQYALDRDATIWIGVGQTVYNQRTPLPAQSQSVSSRLAGARYTVRFIRPTRGEHFVEAFVGAVPTLTGADVYTFLSGQPPAIKPERASEIDASVSLGYRKGSTVWLFGLRSINFAAKFVNTGAAADRNVGIGPLIEWRHVLH